METERDTDPIDVAKLTVPRSLRAADYLWRPWYAKAWWIAIPLYWLPAGTTRGAALEAFYSSKYALATNLLFLPITAILILGFGYFVRLLDEGAAVDPLEDVGFGTRREPGFPHPTMDEFNPMSGPLWADNLLRDKRYG